MEITSRQVYRGKDLPTVYREEDFLNGEGKVLSQE